MQAWVNIIENKKGILFKSLESKDVILRIIDGYTELCSYEEKTHVEPNLEYFFSHPVDVYHRLFEIWDSELKTWLIHGSPDFYFTERS